MKREILFRGKQINKGKWVEGYLIEQEDPEYHAYICMSGFKADVSNQYQDILECDLEEIDPETVGQYTGLTDKNGKKIFEGDIIIYGDTNNRYYGKYAVAFEQRGGSAYFGIKVNENETWQFCLEVHPKIMEVVGSVYDTPDMLGRADMPVPDDVPQPVLMPATPENFELMHG